MYLSEEYKKKIVDFLRKELNPKFIYLFGSFAKGEGRQDSDIDLAIYTDEVISGYTLLMTANDLSFEIKKDVQIVHLKDINTVFAAQIVGTREVLYCEDEELMANYNIRTFKEYVKLNEERKVVLDAIERDGKIYG
ncbi:Predicted nucleotidyltransferase [Anaerovirgula multivorans]|uniref:Predicted nucleotidyltransferase n=1 Tax=Anaerovirgula multivorans TaxID=312168 RepID=A0A239L1N1_9FIRM|nr:nucleotidyltransferase domain-containing protein [Anaerovirgula multivorans]SNT24215.1 Predicted nucleotidyltransferase [Anaerovirgula multivorans]